VPAPRLFPRQRLTASDRAAHLLADLAGKGAGFAAGSMVN
jgi:hypothetical protein